MKKITEPILSEVSYIMYKMAPIIIAVLIITLMTSILKSFNLDLNTTFSTISIIATFLVVVVFTFLITRSKIQTAWNIAIIGFPKSGKTTLLTSMFDEVFSKKYSTINVSITSESTIERVNADLAKLQKGFALGPTKDQDKFSYSTNIELGSLFKRIYKVEFADFPGEDSEEYSMKYGNWLHTTEYFKWVREADAFIFVIDLSKYLLLNQDYIADMSSSIRAAWQNISLTKEKSSSNIKNSPVLLVFTKADLLDFFFEDDYKKKDSTFIKKINELALGKRVPTIRELDLVIFNENRTKVLEDFKALISFFKKDVKSFRPIFTSSFATKDAARLGVEEIFLNILPKNV